MTTNENARAGKGAGVEIGGSDYRVQRTAHENTGRGGSTRSPGVRGFERRWLNEAESVIEVQLPALEAFASTTRSRSPLGAFMRWVDKQAGCRAHPDDVLVHRADHDALYAELRRWARGVLRYKGERLRRSVNFAWLDGGPMDGRRAVKPGSVLIRRTREVA
jgi:hypothetical protein